MELAEKRIDYRDNSTPIYIYPIGDVHMGAYNCAEGHFRKYVDYIKKQKNAYWVGGGDLCDCIVPSDASRYDVRSLADWIFTGDAMTVKEALTDIAKQERERVTEILWPIRDRCLGLIAGNHEEQLMRRSYNAHHYIMCDALKAPNLTDCAFVRLSLQNPSRVVSTVVIFLHHGFGGGRTPGAEPNHMARLRAFIDADIILRGHSHSFRIEPPQPILCIPRKGSLPDECNQREIKSANWGCWLKSYARGPSTYDSRMAYPARTLTALEIEIKPRKHKKKTVAGRGVDSRAPLITMRECSYE